MKAQMTITSDLIVSIAKLLGEDVIAEFYSTEQAESDLLKWLAINMPNLTIDYLKANTWKIQYRVLLSRYTGGYWIIKVGDKSTTQTFTDVSEGETALLYAKIAYSLETLNKDNFRAKYQYTRYCLNQSVKAEKENIVEIKKLKLELAAKNKGFKNHAAMLKAKYEAELKIIIDSGFKRNQAIAIKENARYRPDLKALFVGKTLHPNGYTGSGRHISTGTDHVAHLGLILSKNGFKYETGNDAPKGGFSGMWIKIVK